MRRALIAVLAPLSLVGVKYTHSDNGVVHQWEYNGNAVATALLCITIVVLVIKTRTRLNTLFRISATPFDDYLYYSLWACGVLSMVGSATKTVGDASSCEYYIGNNGDDGEMVLAMILFWHIYKVYRIVSVRLLPGG